MTLQKKLNQFRHLNQCEANQLASLHSFEPFVFPFFFVHFMVMYVVVLSYVRLLVPHGIPHHILL